MWWVIGYFLIGWLVGLWAVSFSNLPAMFKKERPPLIVRLLVLLIIVVFWPIVPFARVL